MDLMPTDDLDEAKASARKLELGQMRKGRFLDESDSDDSSDNSEEERKKKKKKPKSKKNDSTKDDIKTLREEIEGLNTIFEIMGKFHDFGKIQFRSTPPKLSLNWET